MRIGLPAVHPGVFLAEALAELGTSQAEFARAIGDRLVPVKKIVSP